MARRKILTDDGVAASGESQGVGVDPDPELASHYIRVTPSGAKSFVAVTRDQDNRQRWITIGSPPVYNIEGRASEPLKFSARYARASQRPNYSRLLLQTL